MVADQVNAWWWFKLNGLVRHAAVRAVPGFGPSKIVLTEHPKSGATRIGQMVAAYLGVPHPRNRLPPRRRCIVQGHYLQTAEIPGREPDAVGRVDTEFQGVFDGHDPLIAGQQLDQGIQQRGLPGAGAARDEDVVSVRR